jgi:hypothetical protein
MRLSRFAFIWVFVMLTCAYGQEIRYGVKIGVPLTDYFDVGRVGSLHLDATYLTATRRYTVGPAVEFRVTRSLGLELDALYKRAGYDASTELVGAGYFTSNFHVSANSWDFPLLLKSRVPMFPHIFVGTGGVLRYIASATARGVNIDHVAPVPGGAVTPFERDARDLRKRVYPGVAATVSAEFGKGRFRVSPEIRYTRWTSNISPEGGVLRLHPNQVEFLLGFSF